jgi:hypothetical protein
MAMGMLRLRVSLGTRILTELEDARGQHEVVQELRKARQSCGQFLALRDRHMHKALGLLEAWAALESHHRYNMDGMCDGEPYPEDGSYHRPLPVQLTNAWNLYKEACQDIGWKS